MTEDEAIAELDIWGKRLGREKPLRGKECVELQHFLFMLQQLLKEKRK